jgi:hypothetical protein
MVNRDTVLTTSILFGPELDCEVLLENSQMVGHKLTNDLISKSLAAQ